MKNAEVINRMVEKMVEEYKPEKIILFGSYAGGEPDRDRIVGAGFTPALARIAR
jgi:predicted nucleotidyltransferase